MFILAVIDWSALGGVLIGTIAFLLIVVVFGKIVEKLFPPKPEYMSSFQKKAKAAASLPKKTEAPVVAPVVNSADPNTISSEIAAVIVASVAIALKGQKYEIRGIAPVSNLTNDNSSTPASSTNVEQLMSTWSMDGRRQIYSSHQVR